MKEIAHRMMRSVGAVIVLSLLCVTVDGAAVSHMATDDQRLEEDTVTKRTELQLGDKELTDRQGLTQDNVFTARSTTSTWNLTAAVVTEYIIYGGPLCDPLLRLSTSEFSKPCTSQYDGGKVR